MSFISDVIYLDAAFAAESYQRTFDADIEFSYAKSSDSPHSASLKEQFHASLSSHAMYEALYPHIDQITTVKLDQVESMAFPELFWVDGVLGTGTSKTHKENVNYYYFTASDDGGIASLFLATNPVYFATGYDQILTMAPLFTEPFTLQARMLLKYLGSTQYHAIAAPMIVIKSNR